MKQFWEVVKSTNASILSSALKENVTRVASADRTNPDVIFQRLTGAFDMQRHV